MAGAWNDRYCTVTKSSHYRADRHTERQTYKQTYTVYVHTIMCLRIRSATMGLNCIARQSIVIAFIWSYLTTKMYENDRRYFLRHVIQRSHAAWKAERQRWRRCVSLKLSCRPTLSTLMHSKRHAIIKSLRPELVVQSTDLWCSALIHMVMMAIRKLSTGAPWTLQVNDKTIIVWLLT